MSDADLSSDAAPARTVEKKRARNIGIRRAIRALILIVIVWPAIAWVAASALIVRSDLQHADVVVVLGGSSTFVERTQLAATVYKEGRAPMIVVTNDGRQGGWSNTDQRNLFFFESAARELQDAGVPADKIEILPQVVLSTYDEARLLREYAVAHQFHSVLVVTSAYHSRRALWTLRRVFEGSGIQLGLESPSAGWQTPAPATWWLHARGWRLVAGEYVKIVYYHLHY